MIEINNILLCTRLRRRRQILFPRGPGAEQAACAIRRALDVYTGPEFVAWAGRWFAGERSIKEARETAEAAVVVARAALWTGDRTPAAAAWSAEAAARAAVWAEVGVSPRPTGRAGAWANLTKVDDWE